MQPALDAPDEPTGPMRVFMNQTVLRLIGLSRRWRNAGTVGRSGGPTIDAIYGMIVARAREAVFYSNFGVPDTVNGRFDMVVLHLALVLRRLRAEKEPFRQELKVLAQDVFDRFCRDMDDNLREMGVSDIAVPRKMRAFGEAFYGRAVAYDAALDDASGDDALVAALGRNILSDEAATRGAVGLARYVRAAEKELGGISASDILKGRIGFPAPVPEPAGRGI